MGTRESRTRGRVKRTPRLAPVNGLLKHVYRRGRRRRRGLLTKKGGRAGRRRLRNWGQRRKKEKGADFLYTIRNLYEAQLVVPSPLLCPSPYQLPLHPFSFVEGWEAEGKKDSNFQPSLLPCSSPLLLPPFPWSNPLSLPPLPPKAKAAYCKA